MDLQGKNISLRELVKAANHRNPFNLKRGKEIFTFFGGGELEVDYSVREPEPRKNIVFVHGGGDFLEINGDD